VQTIGPEECSKKASKTSVGKRQYINFKGRTYLLKGKDTGKGKWVKNAANVVLLDEGLEGLENKGNQIAHQIPSGGKKWGTMGWIGR